MKTCAAPPAVARQLDPDLEKKLSSASSGTKSIGWKLQQKFGQRLWRNQENVIKNPTKIWAAPPEEPRQCDQNPDKNLGSGSGGTKAM